MPGKAETTMPFVVVFAVVQSLSHVQLFATPWTAVCHVPLSFTISWSLLRFMSTELVMISNHLILCHSLLLLPSIFPSIRVFSNELALRIWWPKYWSFLFVGTLYMLSHWNLKSHYNIPISKIDKWRLGEIKHNSYRMSTKLGFQTFASVTATQDCLSKYES